MDTINWLNSLPSSSSSSSANEHIEDNTLINHTSINNDNDNHIPSILLFNNDHDNVSTSFTSHQLIDDIKIKLKSYRSHQRKKIIQLEKILKRHAVSGHHHTKNNGRGYRRK